MIRQGADADGILYIGINKLTRNVISHLKRCKSNRPYGIGIDAVDVDAATEMESPSATSRITVRKTSQRIRSR
jgi:phosphoglycerate dehydrogenase-like enzyme